LNDKNTIVGVLLMLFVAIFTMALVLDTRQSADGDAPPETSQPAPGQNDDDSESENRWVAVVDDNEIGGLDASNLNETLFIGEMIDQTVIEPDGVVRTEQICEGFPEIEVKRNSASIGPDETTEVTLLLDYSDCTIKLSNVYESTTGALAPSGGGATISPGSGDIGSAGGIVADENLFNEVASHKYQEDAEPAMKQVWDRTWPVGDSQPEPQFSGYRWSSISGETSDGLSISVTEVHLNRRYNVDSLVTPAGGYSARCDTTNVPLVEIDWFEDACLGGNSTGFGYNRAWNHGWFHAEETDDEGFDADLLGPSDHDIKVVLNGTADDEEFSCIFDPSSINDYHIRVHWPLGVVSYHELAATCSYVSNVY